MASSGDDLSSQLSVHGLQNCDLKQKSEKRISQNKKFFSMSPIVTMTNSVPSVLILRTIVHITL